MLVTFRQNGVAHRHVEFVFSEFRASKEHPEKLFRGHHLPVRDSREWSSSCGEPLRLNA
jgi:hypothetical protein